MPSRKQTSRPHGDTEQEIRNQEVLRANRELAAYFKGRRTEREARAALKIIKAFIRDRERIEPGSRPGLPGVAHGNAPGKRPRRTTHRQPQQNLEPVARAETIDYPRQEKDQELPH
jgi:hypothetical protein